MVSAPLTVSCLMQCSVILTGDKSYSGQRNYEAIAGPKDLLFFFHN